MKKIHLSVVSYLPKDLTREAKKMTNILSEKFETYTSKDKWDPHLTVGSGFYVPENKLNELFRDLENLLDKFSKFKIKIKGIDSMTDFTPKFAQYPYVIYLKALSNDKLNALFKTLESYKKFRKGGYMITKYIQHITLAYDDLSRENFKRSLKFLKDINYDLSFEFYIDNVCLVVYSKEKDKNVILKKFKLKKNHKT